MKLQYQKTVRLGGDVEGDIFTFKPGGREVVFIRGGDRTIVKVEPCVHWLLRKLKILDVDKK